MIAKRARPLALWICLAGLAASCASTRLIGDRRNPGYLGGPIASVLVVAISDNLEARRGIEEALVREFRRRGVAAEAGLDALGVETPTVPEAAVLAAERLGMGSVFLARLHEAREERAYTAPIFYDRQFIQGRYEYTYSPTMTGYMLREGYCTTYQVYKLESALYGAKTGGLIWSARSETSDPAAPDRALANLAAAVAENLKKHGLLP
jgi:hypothetical protein